MRTRAAATLVAIALSACTPSPGVTSGADAGSPAPPFDAGSRGDAVTAPPTCFTNPKTYLEIINACTDAEAIDKQVDLSSMNLPDGGLQPLQ